MLLIYRHFSIIVNPLNWALIMIHNVEFCLVKIKHNYVLRDTVIESNRALESSSSVRQEIFELEPSQAFESSSSAH